MLRVLTFWVICVFALVDSKDCQRNEVEQGCTVDHGHAQCESWDLVSGIHGLPSCTTKITFSLIPNPDDERQYVTKIYLGDVNFTHLANLTEFCMVTNQSTYDHFRLWLGERAPSGLPYGLLTLGNHVHILRLKALQRMLPEFAGLYSKLNLEVLDLTRAKQIRLSDAKDIIGKNTGIKTLLLKNIQDIRKQRRYTPDLDIAYFICGTGVRFLDLSYNDITYVNMSRPTKKCNSKLLHLILDHNIMASASHDGSHVLSFLIMIASVETFSMRSPLQIERDDEELWTDHNHNIEFTQDLEEGNDEKSPLAVIMQKTQLAPLAAYDFWFKDLPTHCGHNINYIDMAQCFLHDNQDLCDVFQCLSPTLNLNTCPRDDMSDKKLQYFLQKLCSCLLLPLPPKLKSLVINDAGKLFRGSHRYYSYNLTTICFHPHNSLEHVNVSFLDLSHLKTVSATSGSLSISGLSKLKYVNIQGCQIPLSTFNVLSPSSTFLTELHMGGNVIAPDNTFPANLLQTYTNLALLNLSNANLIGIESNVFVNNQKLSVLDLSFNHLNLSSLSSIDLSKTNIRSLNLSHNRLTAIPAQLRGQLDKMEGLDLYLSGNTFICSCDNLEFLEWVQSSTSITFHYAGDHVCTDSPDNTIHNIAVDSLYCNWYWIQPVIAVASSLSLMLFGIALFVVYRKRWFISNLVFRLRERFSPVSDEQTKISYKYDAFISYSSADGDRQWVHFKLVKELEEKYGFRLCVHQRDFRVGLPIVDNITKAIQSSRKVLVVMSENFLKSDWCIEEIHMTSSVNRNKFVIIMYKGITFSNVEIPAVVQHLLDSRTYTEWNEEPEAEALFWKKLRKALYTKQMASSDESASADWDINQSLL